MILSRRGFFKVMGETGASVAVKSEFAHACKSKAPHDP
jgi:hypothetical protein